MYYWLIALIIACILTTIVTFIICSLKFDDDEDIGEAILLSAFLVAVISAGWAISIPLLLFVGLGWLIHKKLK